MVKEGYYFGLPPLFFGGITLAFHWWISAAALIALALFCFSFFRDPDRADAYFERGTLYWVDKKDHYRAIEVPYSDEEIRRLKDQKGGRTLAEIFADLEKRS